MNGYVISAAHLQPRLKLSVGQICMSLHATNGFPSVRSLYVRMPVSTMRDSPSAETSLY